MGLLNIFIFLNKSVKVLKWWELEYLQVPSWAMAQQRSGKMGQYKNKKCNFSLNHFIFNSKLIVLSLVCHSNTINVFH